MKNPRSPLFISKNGAVKWATVMLKKNHAKRAHVRPTTRRHGQYVERGYEVYFTGYQAT